MVILVEGSPKNTIYSDACGPFKKPTAGGMSLLVTILVIPHRYVKVLLIDSRAEIPVRFRNFTAWAHRNGSKNVEHFHDDIAGEHLSMKSDLKEQGVTRTTSTPYCPHSNGVVEHMN